MSQLRAYGSWLGADYHGWLCSARHDLIKIYSMKSFSNSWKKPHIGRLWSSILVSAGKATQQGTSESFLARTDDNFRTLVTEEPATAGSLLELIFPKKDLVGDLKVPFEQGFTDAMEYLTLENFKSDRTRLRAT